ncbi:MAG: helix-turn-helix transcriptional regulator [Acidobacteriota bacterium]|nr:helix-turn-helix transcriptional regulator [Acidobacteriota bacterium]
MRGTDLRIHLKRFRLSAGLTQEQLAERVGVTRQTILSIEKGRYKPSIELALALARVFDAPVESLFELAPDEEDGT